MTLSTTERQVSLFDRNRIANPFGRYVTLCKSAPVDRNIFDNVEVNENYYQTTPKALERSRGGKTNATSDNSNSEINNYNLSGLTTTATETGDKELINHSNIDETTFNRVLNQIMEIIKDANPNAKAPSVKTYPAPETEYTLPMDNLAPSH